MLFADNGRTGGPLNRGFGFHNGRLDPAVHNIDQDRVQVFSQRVDTADRVRVLGNLAVPKRSVVLKGNVLIGFVIIGLRKLFVIGHADTP